MRAGYVRDFVWKNLDQVSVKQKQCSCWLNLSNLECEDKGRILKTAAPWKKWPRFCRLLYGG